MPLRPPSGRTRLAALFLALVSFVAATAAAAPAALRPSRGRLPRAAPPRAISVPRIPPAVAALSADIPEDKPQPGLPSLREALEQAAEKAASGQDSSQDGAVGDIFDGVRAQSTWLSADTAPAPVLPAGIQNVVVRLVRTVADIDEAIPSHSLSSGLIQRLKGALSRMAPYRVFTYHDALGGVITAIDLSSNPGLVDILPDQYTHERDLIKRIQAWTKDIQVIVFEEGATPDLIVAGTVTELKSVVDPKGSVANSVKKANGQVRDHKGRHGLGNGAVAVHLTLVSKVPVENVLAQLESWRAEEEGGIALDKVFVFAGSDLKVFVRLPDGSYGLQPRVPAPFTPIRPAPGS